MMDGCPRLKMGFESCDAPLCDCLKETTAMSEMRELKARSFAECFVGPEPIAMKAGDTAVIANGAPMRTDFRIISEGNYQRIMEVVERADVKIDELAATPSPSSATDEEVVEAVARAIFEDSTYNSIRWGTATEELKETFRKPARAAILSIREGVGACLKRLWSLKPT